MAYQMLYPVHRTVTSKELINAAYDAVSNHNIDLADEIDIDLAIEILTDLGEITILLEA